MNEITQLLHIDPLLLQALREDIPEEDVSTNSEYGVYVECGTGIYYPGGRQTPWVYQDEKGDWHLTHGQRAKPYIKPAVADHSAQYNRIIEQELKGK